MGFEEHTFLCRVRPPVDLQSMPHLNGHCSTYGLNLLWSRSVRLQGMVTRAVELATRQIEFCNQETNTVYQFPYTKNCIVVVSSHAVRRSMLKLTCLRKKTVVFHPHPTMADRVTRALNATAHPGLVDRNPVRADTMRRFFCPCVCTLCWPSHCLRFLPACQGAPSASYSFHVGWLEALGALGSLATSRDIISLLLPWSPLHLMVLLPRLLLP
jgi:hypothetical protein